MSLIKLLSFFFKQKLGLVFVLFSLVFAFLLVNNLLLKKELEEKRFALNQALKANHELNQSFLELKKLRKKELELLALTNRQILAFKDEKEGINNYAKDSFSKDTNTSISLVFRAVIECLFEQGNNHKCEN